MIFQRMFKFATTVRPNAVLVWLAILYLYVFNNTIDPGQSIHKERAPKTKSWKELSPSSRAKEIKRHFTTCQEQYDAFTIHDSKRWSSDNSTVCKRKAIHPGNACIAMRRAKDRYKNKCNDYSSFEICSYHRVLKYPRNKFQYSFSCDFARKYCQEVYFGTLETNESQVTWKSFNEKLKYEQNLEFLSELVNHLFLQCRMSAFWNIYFQKKGYKFTTAGYAQQLLWFLKEPKSGATVGGKNENMPSISVIFIDSTSRTQFYWTFEKTQELLRSIDQEGKRKVLDYKLFQSIDVSTYWHLYNFFDGANASWKEARNQDIFYFKGSKRFFRKFRRAGYLTAYSWDLCYSCIWRGPYWGEDFLRKKFSRVVGMSGLQLDDTGLAEIVCELASAAVSDSNMLSVAHKCFNGRHFVDYQLQHLEETQTYWSKLGYKYATFLETNINHNPAMDNNFLWDKDLKKYLRTAVKDPDTLLIVFSDHGNKFMTKYVQNQAPEGHVDITHPFLFLILPENESRFFSRSEIEALHKNQNRLLTVRDLHFLLAKFWKPEDQDTKNEKGILFEIPANRSCEDITYSAFGMLPICICENTEFAMSDAEILDAVLFLQKELNSHIPTNFTQTCQELNLRATSKEAFRKYTVKDGSKVFTGIAEVVDYEFKNSTVVFSFYISESKSSKFEPHTNGDLELINFERVDIYSRFKPCAPKNVPNIKVCVCAKNELHKN